MIPFPKYYTRLFNGITDAIEALEAQDHIKAQEILTQAQREAEERYQGGGDPLIDMEDFPKYYHRLSEGATDALKALQEQNYLKARRLLITAQQDAEEMYLEDGDEDEGVDDELSEYTTNDLAPMIAEMNRLEMQILFYESEKAFQTMQAEEAHPEAPDCEKTETE